jgi:hypothetical protein
MEQELHITSVKHYDSKKDGTKMISKNGNPYWRAQIQTEEHGSTYLSGLVFEQLTEGQIIKANVTKNGEYLNFELVKEKKGQDMSPMLEKLDRILREVVAIRQEQVMARQLKESPVIEYPDGPDPADVPF